MHHYIPQETKLKVRAAILSGKSRADIAKEFDISMATVCRATVDLPKNEARAKRLKPGDKERLRELVKNGMSRRDAAKEVGISSDYAYVLTRDLQAESRKGNRNFGEHTMTILQGILKDGYIMSESRITSMDYSRLQERFPIRRIHYKHCTVYFLEDRKEEAFRGLSRLLAGV